MNLKAKALFFFAAAAFSSVTVASECNFDEQKGMDFQFDHIADFDRFSIRNDSGHRLAYPDWFYRPDGHEFVDYREFFRRHAKLQTNDFLRKNEPVEGFADKTTPVRYYKALVENCMTVWVRIDENNPEFSRYFNIQDHKLDGNVPWLWEENTLNIRIKGQYQNLRNHVGKTVVSIPVTDNTILPAYPIASNTLHAVPEFAKFTLDSVRDNAFSVAGHLRSPYSLYVTDAEGTKWRLPWDPEYLSLGNPFNKISLSHGIDSSDILKSQLVFGMSKSEVRLAWGAPHLERNHPVIRDNVTGMQFVKNENYLHDGFQKLPEDRTFPSEDGELIGERTWWFYPNRLESGQYLAFDRNGKLSQSVQARNIYKKRSKPVEVAIDRIR
jgi:hypothetical protein